MRALLVSILEAYVDEGERELGPDKLSQYLTARYGSVRESKSRLGALPGIRDAFNRMQAELYAE